MSKSPYPGYPPNYRNVDKTGGFVRTCVVVEFLSHSPLTNAEQAMIQEQLELALVRLRTNLATLEKSQVVLPDRFDTQLRTGLRLPSE